MYTYIKLGIIIFSGILLLVLGIFIIRRLIRKHSKKETVTKRNYALKHVDFGAFSHIGERDYQQDAFFVPLEISKAELAKKGKLFIMCDGMGGMDMGDVASNLCVSYLPEMFYSGDEKMDIPKFYSESIDNLDMQVSGLKDKNGEFAEAGTTFTSIILKDNNMYWASVGDSRIYLLRKGELIQLTEDHNYGLELMKLINDGVISIEEANDDPEKDALISYIGIDGVEYKDISEKALELNKGDRIFLVSDGLFGTLTSEEIIEIGSQNFDMQIIAQNLVLYAVQKGREFQDNTTAVVVEYK